VHRGHEAGRADLIAESPPDLPNADLEHGVAHHRSGPDALQQRVLGHELPVTLDEAVQHGEGLGRQTNFRRAPPQRGVVRIEPKRREAQRPGWPYVHYIAQR
jgi:hypothetical protein